jgi:hypothetical protein
VLQIRAEPQMSPENHVSHATGLRRPPHRLQRPNGYTGRRAISLTRQASHCHFDRDLLRLGMTLRRGFGPE